MSGLDYKKYEVQDTSVATLLSWITSGEIGLPELQRPFVWKTVKVRDFIDSLYQGFPVGYIITWNNPSVRLKDGTIAAGKKIIIDGQQRVTALQAAIGGKSVLDAHFRRYRIKIAFNPFTEAFQTLNPTLDRDSHWISDISELFADGFQSYTFIKDFAKRNDVDPESVSTPIQNLQQLVRNDIGNIILSSQLPMDQVTEIFNRINSKGTELSTADFIMSKLASDVEHDGNALRKTVEYFSRLLIDPQALENIIVNDHAFSETKNYVQIKWAAKETSKLYQPRFGDIFHVILSYKFGRGKHADLVSLISGRDFKNRTYTEEALSNAYQKLAEGIQAVVNQSNFERYIMILRSLGMLDQEVLAINGMGILNFGYALYLLLKDQQALTESQLESIVKRWLVMSALTSRYSGSAETQSEVDIRKFMHAQPESVIRTVNEEALSDSFWQVTLPQKLMTSSTMNNAWRVFLMAQVYENDIAWLEKDHTVSSLLKAQGNVHHIFPKAYLRKQGFAQSDFNQIANYTWLTQPRNLMISDLAPNRYLHEADIVEYANDKNFEDNAIPNWVVDAEADDYQRFLEERRVLMSKKIHQYFLQL